MSNPYQRPLGLWSKDVGVRKEDIRDLPPSLTNIPWIDIHQHIQTLSYSDRAKLDWSGCHAAIMIATNYHWSPYRPVEPEDVRFLWDLALRWTSHINYGHFFNTFTAIGIHTLARVTNYMNLIDSMSDYCNHDSVVAIGETGIEPVQYSSTWPIDEQKDVVTIQMEIAKKHDIPLILHTPTQKTTSQGNPKLAWREYTGVLTEPQFDYGEKTKLETTKMDIKLKDEAGLSDDGLVVDHADRSIIPFVMEDTDCYLSFTVGYPQNLRQINSQDIIGAIEEYGPDRIMIDSDLAGSVPTDPFAVKRTLLELYAQGLDEESIRKIAYDNPRKVFEIV